MIRARVLNFGYFESAGKIDAVDVGVVVAAAVVAHPRGFPA